MFVLFGGFVFVFLSVGRRGLLLEDIYVVWNRIYRLGMKYIWGSFRGDG